MLRRLSLAPAGVLMAVRGDMKGLHDLERKLASIASGQARAEAIQVCAEAAMKVLDDEFRAGKDPYGNAWAPLKMRTGKPLLDTGMNLLGSLHPEVTSSGFTITTNFKGAAVHQYGATIRPTGAKALAFHGRGKPSKSNPRGKRTGMIFTQKVTIPRRQYMPEGTPGRAWRDGLERAADTYIRQHMGGK